jgi:AbrB family looped-hinge helix DNA binding protein
MLSTVRVQEKGQVTIPSDIRKKLRLKKGDLVTFVIQENGVMIQSVEVAVQDLLKQLENALNQRGISLEALITASQKVGGEAAARRFRLSKAEKTTYYLALQLQAQQALETIRLHSERLGLDQTTEAEIEAEINEDKSAVYRVTYGSNPE